MEGDRLPGLPLPGQAEGAGKADGGQGPPGLTVADSHPARMLEEGRPDGYSVGARDLGEVLQGPDGDQSPGLCTVTPLTETRVGHSGSHRQPLGSPIGLGCERPTPAPRISQGQEGSSDQDPCEGTRERGSPHSTPLPGLQGQGSKAGPLPPDFRSAPELHPQEARLAGPHLPGPPPTSALATDEAKLDGVPCGQT